MRLEIRLLGLLFKWESTAQLVRTNFPRVTPYVLKLVIKPIHEVGKLKNLSVDTYSSSA
jgi:hypothetical protein